MHWVLVRNCFNLNPNNENKNKRKKENKFVKSSKSNQDKKIGIATLLQQEGFLEATPDRLYLCLQIWCLLLNATQQLGKGA